MKPLKTYDKLSKDIYDYLKSCDDWQATIHIQKVIGEPLSKIRYRLYKMLDSQLIVRKKEHHSYVLWRKKF